jgi:hypothetical protein
MQDALTELPQRLPAGAATGAVDLLGPRARRRRLLALPAGQGIDELAWVRPDLRAFLAAETERRPALSSQARTVAAPSFQMAAADQLQEVARQRQRLCIVRPRRLKGFA